MDHFQNYAAIVLEFIQSQLQFPVVGLTFQASMLSDQDIFEVEILTQKFLESTALIQQRIRITWGDAGHKHYRHGFIDHYQLQKLHREGYCYQFTIKPFIAMLATTDRSRTFIPQKFTTIITDLTSALRQWDCVCSVRGEVANAHLEYKVQYRETNLAFIRKLLAEQNCQSILNYFESHTKWEIGDNFNDFQCPTKTLAVVKSSQQLPQYAAITNFKTIVMQKEMRLLYRVVETDADDLQVGQILTLSKEDEPEESFRVLAIEATWRGIWRTKSILAEIDASVATCLAILKCLKAPAATHNNLGLHLARIESIARNNSAIDATGAYRARFDFDNSTHAEGEATLAIKRILPFNNAHSENAGSHFPLSAGTEIATIMVEGLLQQPMIVNAMTAKYMPSPVNIENANEHCFRTSAGNVLQMIDEMNSERVTLATANSENKIALEMSMSPSQTLVSSERQGISLQGGSNIYLQSDADAMLDVTVDSKINAGREFSTSTINGDVAAIAKNSINFSVSRDFYLQAGNGSLQLKASQELQFTALNGLHFQAKVISWDIKTDLNLEATTIHLTANESVWCGNELATFNFNAIGQCTLNARAIIINAPIIDVFQ